MYNYDKLAVTYHEDLGVHSCGEFVVLFAGVLPRDLEEKSRSPCLSHDVPVTSQQQHATLPLIDDSVEEKGTESMKVTVVCNFKVGRSLKLSIKCFHLLAVTYHEDLGVFLRIVVLFAGVLPRDLEESLLLVEPLESLDLTAVDEADEERAKSLSTVVHRARRGLVFLHGAPPGWTDGRRMNYDDDEEEEGEWRKVMIKSREEDTKHNEEMKAGNKKEMNRFWDINYVIICPWWF